MAKAVVEGGRKVGTIFKLVIGFFVVLFATFIATSFISNSNPSERTLFGLFTHADNAGGGGGGGEGDCGGCGAGGCSCGDDGCGSCTGDCSA